MTKKENISFYHLTYHFAKPFLYAIFILRIAVFDNLLFQIYKNFLLD
ncbi:Uncharacterised protein [Sphingobacterium spiritivorum]|nr:Uncharacterised protein [Sphingobacterium spiritivorum]